MTITTNGATFKAFYDDEAYWGDCYHDDVRLMVDGSVMETLDSEKILDASQVEILEGASTMMRTRQTMPSWTSSTSG